MHKDQEPKAGERITVLRAPTWATPDKRTTHDKRRAPEKRGFDPYDCGSFDRSRNWSGIGKR